MTRLYSNRFVRGWRGTAANPFLNCITRSGNIIIADKSMFDDHRALANTEKSHQDDFSQATSYASFASNQEEYIREAKSMGTTAYSIALTDWFGAPKVLEINVDNWTGEIGQTLRVKARDNFMVARVTVVIRDVEGKVLETGDAVQSAEGSAWWNYTTQSLVTMTPFPIVEAVAWDRPGNKDSFIIS